MSTAEGHTRDFVDAVAHQQPNACDLIHTVSRTHGDVVALVDLKTGTRLTFRELSTRIAQTASRLQACGLNPRDRVAVFVAEGPAFVILVNSLFHLGAVPVLIDPGMGAANVATCIQEQKPRGLVGVPKAHALRLLKRTAFASVQVKVVVDGFFPGAQRLRLVDNDGVKDTYLAMHRQAKDQPAAVLYTSGSTGAPKGVLYTHGMLMAQATAIRDMFAINKGDIDVCCFLPFALFSVAMGTTAVFPDMDFRFPAKARPEAIRRALVNPLGDGVPASSAFASPALWAPFAESLSSSNPLVGVKRILTAGAPVSPRLHQRLLAGLPDGDVWTPYGATEALPVAFMNGRAIVDETAAKTEEGKGTCVGKLAPGIRVRIVAVTDEAIATIDDAPALAPGEIGEIVVAGPCVTAAYDETSDRAREANRRSKIKDGDTVWHRMGDVGWLDDQGRLWFLGRKAHRVETVDGTLHSLQVEAVAERVWPARAALVWMGARPEQRAVLLLEPAQGGDVEGVKAAIASVTPIDVDIRVHTATFPVDRRHNAKIEREALAAGLVAIA